MKIMLCSQCKQEATACAKCYRRLSPCSCDLGAPPPPLRFQREPPGQLTKEQDQLTKETCLDSEGQLRTIDTDAVCDVLSKFLGKKTEDSCEPIESCDPRQQPQKSEQSAHVQALEKQLGEICKQNCELTKTLSKVAQGQDVNNQSNPQCNQSNSQCNQSNLQCNQSNQQPLCSIPRMGTDVLREQLENIQMGISLADMIDMNREIQGGYTGKSNNIYRRKAPRNSEAEVQRELVETLKEMKDELKEVKQHQQIRSMAHVQQPNRMLSALSDIAGSMRNHRRDDRPQRGSSSHSRQNLQGFLNENTGLRGHQENMRKGFGEVKGRKRSTKQRVYCPESSESQTSEISMSIASEQRTPSSVYPESLVSTSLVSTCAMCKRDVSTCSCSYLQ